eukprot:m.350952 g.350952  ORF g.350952 m.350952 type:complete len:167 (+) comp19894_c0_seq3:3543-4043(+)
MPPVLGVFGDAGEPEPLSAPCATVAAAATVFGVPSKLAELESRSVKNDVMSLPPLPGVFVLGREAGVGVSPAPPPAALVSVGLVLLSLTRPLSWSTVALALGTAAVCVLCAAVAASAATAAPPAPGAGAGGIAASVVAMALDPACSLSLNRLGSLFTATQQPSWHS